MTGNHALRRAQGRNVFEAFRRVCYEWAMANPDQGMEGLALLMGYSRTGTLYNKADAGDDSHNQPTLKDVVRLTQVTGRLDVLDAAEELFGRVAFDAARHAEASDEALLELLCRVGAENGEFHQAVLAGLQARRFGPADYLRVREEAMDVVGALMTLVHRLEGLIDDQA